MWTRPTGDTTLKKRQAAETLGSVGIGYHIKTTTPKCPPSEARDDRPDRVGRGGPKSYMLFSLWFVVQTKFTKFSKQVT
jgi:hypothetical protein